MARSWLATAALSTSLAQAQIDVAICAAAHDSTSACQFTDPRDKLLATGLFHSVDLINVTAAGAGTPALTQLQQYDALLCWTNATPADNDAWGDVLADYVDAGGGVVVAVFANSSTTVGRNIGGRWQSGYEVILDQSGTTSGSATLGLVRVPAHPVMSGVSSFYGGSSSHRPTATALAAGATLVAEWSDGRVLVAQGQDPRRIDLGFHPPSSACVSWAWDASTDGARLIANALVFVSTAGGSCDGSLASYCTPGTTTNGCTAQIAGLGVPSASAASGFTLSITGVEGQKQGIVFYGVSGQAIQPWASGSSSYLCVALPVQRMGVQSSGGILFECNGTLSVDWNAFRAAHPTALGAPFAPGQTVHAQAWFRDPSSPKTTSLSNALRFVVCS